MKIGPYYRRQKYRQLTPVSGDKKFVWIFAGVLWRGASNDSWVIENVNFHGFLTLRLRHIIIQYGNSRGVNAVLMRTQSCVEAYAEDAQAPASSFGSEKEGSLSKA